MKLYNVYNTEGELRDTLWEDNLERWQTLEGTTLAGTVITEETNPSRIRVHAFVDSYVQGTGSSGEKHTAFAEYLGIPRSEAKQLIYRLIYNPAFNDEFNNLAHEVLVTNIEKKRITTVPSYDETSSRTYLNGELVGGKSCE